MENIRMTYWSRNLRAESSTIETWNVDASRPFIDM